MTEKLQVAMVSPHDSPEADDASLEAEELLIRGGFSVVLFSNELRQDHHHTRLRDETRAGAIGGLVIVNYESDLEMPIAPDKNVRDAAHVAAAEGLPIFLMTAMEPAELGLTGTFETIVFGQDTDVIKDRLGIVGEQ